MLKIWSKTMTEKKLIAVAQAKTDAQREKTTQASMVSNTALLEISQTSRFIFLNTTRQTLGFRK